jgi:hypothetical protein
MRDHRRAMIRHYDKFKPIRQSKVADLGTGIGGARGGAHKPGNEQQKFRHSHPRAR